MREFLAENEGFVTTLQRAIDVIGEKGLKEELQKYLDKIILVKDSSEGMSFFEALSKGVALKEKCESANLMFSLSVNFFTPSVYVMIWENNNGPDVFKKDVPLKKESFTEKMNALFEECENAIIKYNSDSIDALEVKAKSLKEQLNNVNGRLSKAKKLQKECEV